MAESSDPKRREVTQDMSTVSDAMREYVKEEVLTGNERWFCERCKAGAHRLLLGGKDAAWILGRVLLIQGR